MKIIMVRIEDNSGKIEEIQTIKNRTEEYINEKAKTIKELQEECFMQILAYLKCAYEDYIGIVGETTPINEVSWRENRLDVSNVTRSVRICVRKHDVIIDFDYSGTFSCDHTPPRMEAVFKNNEIIITKSTPDGICDLMNRWENIKPEFQKKIDNAYDKKKKEFERKVSNADYMLKIAKEFRV